jgi:hypothetical protein
MPGFSHKINVTVLRSPDMQKFPLRMKDNDLLVTELYRDPSNDPITAISVYLTPKSSKFIFILKLITYFAT